MSAKTRVRKRKRVASAGSKPRNLTRRKRAMHRTVRFLSVIIAWGVYWFIEQRM